MEGSVSVTLYICSNHTVVLTFNSVCPANTVVLRSSMPCLSSTKASGLSTSKYDVNVKILRIPLTPYTVDDLDNSNESGFQYVDYA